jgi:hypothetical protein
MVPSTIAWLFVALSGPLSSYPAHKVLYGTTDEAACKAQAAEWNAAIAPLKPQYFCLKHRQMVLTDPDGR